MSSHLRCHTFLLILQMISLVLLVTPVQVNAYYCDHDYCSAEQFCCGENICCDYVNNTIWHMICFFISVIVFGFVLWGLVQCLLEIINSWRRQCSDSGRDIEQSSASGIERNASSTSSAPKRITLQYLVKHFIQHATQKNKANSNNLMQNSSSQAFLVNNN